MTIYRQNLPLLRMCLNTVDIYTLVYRVFFTQFLLKILFFVDNPAVPVVPHMGVKLSRVYCTCNFFFRVSEKYKQTVHNKTIMVTHPPTRMNHRDTDRTLLSPSSSNWFQNRLNGRANTGVTGCQPNASCWSVKSSTVFHWQLFDKLSSRERDANIIIIYNNAVRADLTENTRNVLLLWSLHYITLNTYTYLALTRS